MTVRMKDSGGVASGGVDTVHRNLTLVCARTDLRTGVLCTTAECISARRQLLQSREAKSFGSDFELSSPLAALAVEQIRPALGATDGSYRVRIATSGQALFALAHSLDVYLGDLPCANVTIETESMLSCVVPAGTGCLLHLSHARTGSYWF
jgi:hypothetical protein